MRHAADTWPADRIISRTSMCIGVSFKLAGEGIPGYVFVITLLSQYTGLIIMLTVINLNVH